MSTNRSADNPINPAERPLVQPPLARMLEALDALDPLAPSPARVVRSPGRVNLLGEHTDYNDGFVLPVAIDRELWLAFRPRADRQVVLQSLDLGLSGTFSLDALRPSLPGDWLNYPKGVAAMLERAGYRLDGLTGVIGSTLPAGAGMSSSAALEVAAGRAFAILGQFPIDGAKLARLGQQAEHEFAGVACGIMDQMVVACAQAGHALFLDCRTLERRAIPLPASIALVICDSGVQRKLQSSEYNLRRRQCEEGVQRLRQHLPGIRALRDVTSSQLAALQSQLPPIIARRCAHVIAENERVLAAVNALERGDGELVGQLFYASHQSLRELYEVSCPELDTLVAIARETPGVLGARLTGAGFGGCTVNLVQRDAVPALVDRIRREYQTRTGRAAAIYVCETVPGASLLTP